MLFETYRVNRWKRLAAHYKQLAEMGVIAQDPKEETNKLWRRYNHYARQIYNYEQQRWYAETAKELSDAHPYGAFYSIPKILFDLIQRCHEYWHNGYNVWAAEEYAAPIRAQVAYAWGLAQECLQYWETASRNEFPQDKLIELFTYVAEHVQSWSD